MMFLPVTLATGSSITRMITPIIRISKLTPLIHYNNSISFYSHNLIVHHTTQISSQQRSIGGFKFHQQFQAESKNNNNINKNQKDQFIHDHLNSSQYGGTANPDAEVNEHDIVQEPPRERFGVLKAVIIIIAGIYFGAYVAMVGAKLLEDLDIFVGERDDENGDGDGD